MHSSLKLLPLAAVTVAVGFSLTAKRNPVPVPVLRQLAGERQSAISQVGKSNTLVVSAYDDNDVDKAGLGRIVGKTIFSGAVRDQSDVPHRNGDVAREVASALKHAKLADHEIDISVQNSVITLDGVVASPEQRTAAGRAAASVGQSMRVVNRLTTVAQDTICAGHSDRNVAKTELSELPKGAKSDAADVLRVGMTAEEVLAALDSAHMDGGWGGAGWTKFWCTSRRFPAKTVSLTFHHDASNTLRLKLWYLSEAR